VKSKLESSFQKDLIKWGKDHEVLIIKTVAPGENGFPDTVCIGKMGTLFLELKKRGEKPAPLQERFIRQINSYSSPMTAAAWSDNLEDAISKIKSYCLR